MQTTNLLISYIEIYNETVFDLLSPREKLEDPLQIAEDSKGFFYIKGLTEESVSSIEEVLLFLQKGEENRHYAQTIMNHSSSRSHTVFRLKISTSKETFLSFVDLGGSEKVSNLYNNDSKDQNPPLTNRTSTPGRRVSHLEPQTQREKSKSPIRSPLEKSPSNVKERVKEGQYLNKSLFFLTQVLAFRTSNASFTDNKEHIGFRNSALTKILKSSLLNDGTSKIGIICCITPSLSHFDHTMSTLRFGTSAKRFHSGAFEPNFEKESNIEGEEENKRLLEENSRLKEENEALKRRITRNNAKTMLEYLKKLPRSYKKEFLDQIREDIALLPTNGLIFMTKNNKKYGLKDPSNKNLSLKNNWQELIFDYEGVFALRNFVLIKDINKRLFEKFTMIKTRFETILIESDLKEQISRLQYQNMMKLMYKRFKKFENELKKAFHDASKALKRLEIFEKYDNLNSLNEGDLEKLERHLLKGFDLVKEERFRRKYDKDYIVYKNNISESKSYRKNESILKEIESFLDFSQIKAALDFEIEEDIFEKVDIKEALNMKKLLLKETLQKAFDEIMKDGDLYKKIDKLQEYDLLFHQKFEMKVPEKKYEDLGLYEETFNEDLIDNFIDDKEFLGENLPISNNIDRNENNNQKKENFVRTASPLEKKTSNSYEDLLQDLNTSFNNNEKDISFQKSINQAITDKKSLMINFSTSSKEITKKTPLSTPNRLQKPDLKHIQRNEFEKNIQKNNNMGFLDFEHDEYNDKMNINETKIKTEGEDTIFSASIFEDSGSDKEGWLFEDDKKDHKTNNKDVCEKKNGLEKGTIVKRKK